MAESALPDSPPFLVYQRHRFITHLPLGYRYTASHYWLGPQADGQWRIGFTKFAMRMLGEMVDFDFSIPERSAVQVGQIIGWVEGFKAVSDVYCLVDGQFLGHNPALKEQTTLLQQDPCDQGWLYLAQGQPDAQCMDAHGYQAILDKIIDRLAEKK